MQDTSVQKSLKDKFESGQQIELGSTPKSSSLKDRFESAKPIITDDMYETIEQPESEEKAEDGTYLTDDLKKKRIEEIEAEMAAISAEQNQIAKKINKPTMANALLPIGAFAEDRKSIQERTAKLRALRVEQNELKNKLTPPTDKEKEEALNSFGIGSYNNDSESAFKDYDFIAKHGAKKAFNAYNEALKDRLVFSKKVRLQDSKPETILSYANMVYGEKQELKHASEKDLDNIYGNLLSKNEYRTSSFDQKIKMIDKAVSEYVSSLEIKTAEGQQPPDKTDIKNRILSNILPKFMYSEDGGLSPEGVKLFLNDQLSEVNELADFYEKAILDAGFNITSDKNQSFLTGLQSESDVRFNELAEKHGRENMRQWRDNIRQEYFSLKSTAKTIERLLEYPEAKAGIRDIGKVIKTTDPKSLYTLMTSDMLKSMDINGIVKKLEEDKPITYAEKKELEAFATMNYLQSLGTEGTAFKVGKGVINMLPYVAQFAITKGGFTAVKGAATKALSGYGTKTIFKLARKEVTAQKLATTALGTAAQTAALPQQYVTNIIKYAQDNVSLAADPEMNELVSKIDVNSGMPIGKAIARGVWDAYSEIYTERLGGYMKISPKLRGKVGNLTNEQLLKNTAVAAFMKSKGVTSIKEFSKSVSKAAGWHGIMEEYFEEVANYYMAGIADPKNIKGPANKEWRQQQLDTFLTVAAFSPIMKTADFVTKETIGKNVRLDGTYSDGKKFSIKLPSKLYNELGNIFSESSGLLGEKESERIDSILDKYEGKLSKEQFNLALHLVSKLGQDKQADIIATQGAGSILDMKVETPIETDQTLTEKNVGKFSEEERKEIKEENDRVSSLYPDLVDNNLVPVDPSSGQLIEPDKNSISVMLGGVNKQIESIAQHDDKGNITNPSDELNKLLEKQTILQDRLTQFEELDTKNFLDLSVSEKNVRLQKELTAGRDLAGTAEIVTDRKIAVKLDDGRSVSAYLDPKMSKEEKSKITDAVISNKKVSLRLVKQTEWNPLLEITDDLGVPFGDKIDVILDGKSIGSVQITDFREKKAKDQASANKKEQQKKQFVDKLIEARKPKADDSSEKKLTVSEVAGKYKDVTEFSAFIREFLDKNGLTLNTEYSYAQINKLIGIPNSEIVRQILSPIESYIKKTGAKIVFVNAIEDGAADYSTATNNIRIPLRNMAVNYAKLKAGSRKDMSWFDHQYWLSETFIHELIHTITAQKIDIADGHLPYLERFISSEERQIVTDINRIMDFIKLNYPEDRQMYGFKNANEFIAEAFSNQEFAAYLAAIQIDDYVYQAPSAFVALIKKILELLGFKSAKNSALESVINLTTDLASGYDAKIADEISDEIQLHDILFGGKGPGEHKLDVEGFVSNLSSEEKNEIKKGLFDAINAITDIQDITISEVIPMLEDAIEGTDAMSDEEKQTWKAMIKENQKRIIAHVLDKHFKKKGFSKKDSKLTIDDLVFPELEGVAFSSGQKVQTILNGYSRIWKDISDVTGITKNTIEKTFYRIAKTGQFNGEVHNEAQFHEYLSKLKGRDIATDEIIKVLERSSFKSSLSLFQFYNSVRLVRQFGFIATDTTGAIRLLNPPDTYEEYVDTFWNKIRKYSYLGYEGFQAIEKRLRDHITERNRLFMSSKSSYPEFESLTAEERTQKRKQQHDNDIALLSEITGIQQAVWRDYFGQETREVYANPSRGSDILTNYVTYDNLLENDTYRGRYTRIQSTLMYSLLYKSFRNENNEPRTFDEFKEYFIQFFTQGDETKGALSNLYKLSTASKETDDIALNGTNIKGDNFSSFVQDSMLFTIAENIRKHHISNDLTKYYFRKEKDAEIIIIDGIANTKYDKKASADELSYEDLWMMQLHEFVQPGDSYRAWMGQFGDKPALYFLEVPKRQMPLKDSSEYNDLLEKFPEFEKAVDWIHHKFINYRQSFFNSFLPSPPSNMNEEELRAYPNIARRKLAEEFVYNFAMNMGDIMEIFHGDFASYDNDLISVVKRGGSSVSNGRRDIAIVEGGLAETYQFALVEDKIKGFELFDGNEFATSDYMDKWQVSMGSMFSKEETPGMETLSSVKALHSNIDPNTNLRGLTKGNIINIEILAKAMPGSKYEDVFNFMREHQIDRLSFGSTTKQYEKAKGKAAKKAAMIKLWDDNGNKLKSPVIPEFGIITRNTADTYTQQDLRHQTAPKASKMSSQTISNISVLPHGNVIAERINSLQHIVINEMIDEIQGKTIDAAKLDWLRDNLNENTHLELQRLLQLGMTPYDPGFANYIRKILASHVTKKSLQVPINRTTTQEIPDVDRILKVRRFSSDKKHILLPEIVATIDGARYEDTTFKGKTHVDKEGKTVYDAIDHVLSNRSKYEDLFNSEGRLMEWEITDNDGVIPGEIILSARTPSEDLHSYTVARLKFTIPGGNFTMLDWESQKRSGSDFDGDQRFNWVLYHGKNESIKTGSSKEGVTNEILRLIAEDYTNPAINDKIIEPIDTDAYNPIVDKLRAGRSYNIYDPQSWNKLRDENMVGVKMKGILTNIITVYGLINNKRINFKSKVNLRIGKEEIVISGVNEDVFGLMKSNIANLLNMAFDNAKDPKIELMGLNEVTAGMFMLSMFGDKSVNLIDRKAINDHIEKVVKYFTSPMLREFTELVRRNNGAMRDSTMDDIKKILLNLYEENDVKQLISFYYAARDLSDIRKFYSLTQEMPKSVVDLQISSQLYDKIKNNQLKFIDTRNLFDSNGRPVIEFAIAENNLIIARDFVFKDTFEYSMTGREIYQAIFSHMKKSDSGKKYIEEDELRAISYAFNAAATLRAIGVKSTLTAVERDLVKNLQSYRDKYPGNKFLQAISIIKSKGKSSVQINSDDKRRKMSDKKLDEIRNDFDIIFESEPNLTDKLIFYAVSKWGTATSTWSGSYFNLASDAYRVMLSKKMQNQLYEWDVEGLSSDEKYQIMQLTLRSAKDKDMRAMSDTNPKYPASFNYNAIASLDYSISYDALSGIEHISTHDELIEFENTHGFDFKSLNEYKDSIAPGVKTKPWAREELAKFKRRAEQFFPVRPKPEGNVRDMMPNDAVSELLASEDPELQAFVFDHLKKRYPGVRFFADHDAFVEFALRWGVKGFQINPEAIGHAFGDAVYIDPSKAVQSTQFHEYGHIYWDALPEDHAVKMALMELYRGEYPGSINEDIEEQIILDIGRAGIDLAKIEMRGSVLDKFVNLLRNFWKSIKVMFGSKKKEDLIDTLAYAIWKNSGSIKVGTNYAEANLKNMVSFNNKQENLTFNGETHTYFIGNMPIPSATTTIKSFQNAQFEPDMASAKSIEKYKSDYELLTKERLLTNKTDKLIEKLMALYEDYAEKGTVVHAVAESVFGNRVITAEEKAQFMNIKDYYDLINEFEDLKKNILAAHPDAIFYTERMLFSKKYNIAGIIDLAVDIGDDKLILYDFKTTSDELADVDMMPLEGYKKSYGPLRAPFQNISQSKYSSHMLQLNMYANMAEEQEDPNQPDKRNKVDGLRIIPIIRKLKDGKIESIRMANHHVKIPRNSRTADLLDRMMMMNLMSRQNFEQSYPEVKDMLRKSGIAIQSQMDSILAYHFWKQMVPDLKNIKREDVESIRGTEFDFMKTWLLANGFTHSDLYGTKAMPFEYLFYNAFYLRLSRKEFINSLDTYFPEQEVNKRFKFIYNPDSPPRKWHKITHEGEEYIIHEEGYSTLKPNDEIMMIYDTQNPLGENERDVYFYTVISVGEKSKSILARNQETGKDVHLRLPSGTSGALKVVDSLPEGIVDPGSDSYVPRYNFKKESDMERHFDFSRITTEHTGEKLSDPAERLRARSIRTIQRIMKQFDNVIGAEEYLSDTKQASDLFIELSSLDNVVSGHLVTFLQEISFNQFLADSIAKENQDERPYQPFPMTLNAYYIATMNSKAVWTDFDTMEGIRLGMPQRMMENYHLPLSMFTVGVEDAVQSYTEEGYELQRKFKKFQGKIDYDKAIVKLNGEAYWRTPGEKALENEPLIREFLELLYEYHHKYDPYQANNVKNNLVARIPVVSVYFTRPEALERFGNKWGPVMYERLKPQKYDGVRLNLLKIVDGKYVKDVNSDGKPKTMTLREIKESFVAFNIDDRNERRKMLGKRWRHFMKIPGTITVAGQVGLLNEYIKRAEKIYRKGGDVNNLDQILQTNKKSIPIIGNGKTAFATKYLLEAETKAIDSMMFRYYLKDLMGPLEYMINMYTKTGDEPAKHIIQYLQEWGEYILYNKAPEGGMLSGKTISDVVDFGNRMNSLNKIMFSLKTQGVNLAIGQALDVIREPAAYRRGMSRMLKNPLKAMKMAKRFGLANIVDDVLFDQLEKEIRVFGVDIKKIEDYGYKLMEWAEKLNQFPIFTGLMTEAEWNAYDENAELVIPENMLTNWRRRMILWRVQDIHGDYRKVAMAPWWIHNSGKAFMQFKKWMPAYIWSHVAPYHIDKNLMVRSGIIPTLKLLGKLAIYNNKPVEKRQKQLQDIIEKEDSGEGPVSPKYFGTAQEYLDTLIKEVNGGRVTFKDLAENDKKNFRSAIMFGMFQVLFTLTIMAMTKGSDDPDEYKKFSVRNFLPILKRFNGDVFWIYSTENWQYFFENIIPSASLLLDLSAFTMDLVKWEKYKKDTLAADVGFPKFIMDATYFIPAGSFIRWLNQKARVRVWKSQEVNLYELGIDQDTLDLLGLESGIVSKFDIKESAFKYGKMYQMIKRAYQYDALMNKGIPTDEYYDLYFGEKLLKQERNQLTDALNGMRLEEMYQNGELGDIEQIADKARAMLELERRKEKQTKKQVRKELDEALEKNR